MTVPVKRLYKAAKDNKTFRQELKNVGEKHYKPSILWDNKQKAIYACVYMGWLVARGQYKESDYEY